MPKTDFKTRWAPLFSIYLSFHERDSLFFTFRPLPSKKRNYLEMKPKCERSVGLSPVLRPSWHSTDRIEPTIPLPAKPDSISNRTWIGDFGSRRLHLWMGFRLFGCMIFWALCGRTSHQSLSWSVVQVVNQADYLSISSRSYNVCTIFDR